MSIDDFISLHLEEIYKTMLQYRKCEKNYFDKCLYIAHMNNFTYNNTCTPCHNKSQLDYQNRKNQTKKSLKNQVSQLLETRMVPELPQGIKIIDILTTKQMTQIMQESSQPQTTKPPKLNVFSIDK